MCVIDADCVHFDVEAISWEELLVEIGAICPNRRFPCGWEELGASVFCLSEQHTVARSTRAVDTVVDHDFVIFCVDWLLNERFLESLAPDHDAVIELLDLSLLVFEQDVLVLVVVAADFLIFWIS